MNALACAHSCEDVHKVSRSVDEPTSLCLNCKYSFNLRRSWNACIVINAIPQRRKELLEQYIIFTMFIIFLSSFFQQHTKCIFREDLSSLLFVLTNPGRGLGSNLWLHPVTWYADTGPTSPSLTGDARIQAVHPVDHHSCKVWYGNKACTSSTTDLIRLGWNDDLHFT